MEGDTDKRNIKKVEAKTAACEACGSIKPSYHRAASFLGAVLRLRKHKANARRAARNTPRWRTPVFWQQIAVFVLFVLLGALTFLIFRASKPLADGWLLVTMLCWVVVAQMIIDVSPWRTPLRKAYFTATYRAIALGIALTMLAWQGRYPEVFCHVIGSDPCNSIKQPASMELRPITKTLRVESP